MPTKKPRKTDLDKELRQVYKDHDVDMATFTKASRSPWKKVVVTFIGFFALLAIISWAGFFLFSPTRNSAINDKVKITFDGPTQVKSGDLVSYTITILNTATIPVSSSAIDLRLPKEFSLSDTTPKLETNATSWRLGAISPKKSMAVTIRGVFLGAIGATSSLQATLTYRPSDFNADFQKVNNQTITISDSVFVVTATGPAKTVPGEKVSLQFSYTNGSANTFNQVQFNALYPPGFTPESSSPKAADDTNTSWTIPTIAANAKGSITVIGTFAADVQGNQDIKGQIGFLNDAQLFQLQKETVLTIQVGQGDLITTLSLNGKSENQYATFGSFPLYSLSYRNTGKTTLNNVTFAVNFSFSPTTTTLIFFPGTQDKNKGIVNGNQIVWTKQQIKALTKIKPGDQGTIEFRVPVIASNAPELTTNTNYQIIADTDTQLQSADGQTSISVSKNPPLVATLNSDVGVTAGPYYDEEGKPAISGPLPPIVGQKTTYRITWMISNTVHDLTNLTLTAPLPSNVTWGGISSVDAGDLRYDQTTNKVTWTLNWLPTSIKIMKVNFDVTLKPTSSQKGKTPLLLDQTIFSGTDKVTNAALQLTAPAVTTDSAMSGKGKVQ